MKWNEASYSRQSSHSPSLPSYLPPLSLSLDLSIYLSMYQKQQDTWGVLLILRSAVTRLVLGIKLPWGLQYQATAIFVGSTHWMPCEAVVKGVLTVSQQMTIWNFIHCQWLGNVKFTFVWVKTQPLPQWTMITWKENLLLILFPTTCSIAMVFFEGFKNKSNCLAVVIGSRVWQRLDKVAW
jgi:hypothetical protein